MDVILVTKTMLTTVAAKAIAQVCGAAGMAQAETAMLPGCVRTVYASILPR